MLKYQQIKITYVLPIYLEESLDPFYELLNTYGTYKKELLRQIHFIFVDDCSPLEIVIPKDCRLNYTLARVTSNIKWNQGGARNLGVHLAKSSKLILTDLDHTFTQECFEHLLRRPQPSHLYVFKRLDENHQEKVPHYNTFFCTKSLYFKSLGVDECFKGNYGFEDVFFIDFHRRLGTKILKIRDYPVYHLEHKNTDKPQHNLSRSMEVNRPVYEAKRRIVKDRSKDPFDAHSRLFLDFEWVIKYELIVL